MLTWMISKYHRLQRSKILSYLANIVIFAFSHGPTQTTKARQRSISIPRISRKSSATVFREGRPGPTRKCESCQSNNSAAMAKTERQETVSAEEIMPSNRVRVWSRSYVLEFMISATRPCLPSVSGSFFHTDNSDTFATKRFHDTFHRYLSRREWSMNFQKYWTMTGRGCNGVAAYRVAEKRKVFEKVGRGWLNGRYCMPAVSYLTFIIIFGNDSRFMYNVRPQRKRGTNNFAPRANFVPSQTSSSSTGECISLKEVWAGCSSSRSRMLAALKFLRSRYVTWKWNVLTLSNSIVRRFRNRNDHLD